MIHTIRIFDKTLAFPKKMGMSEPTVGLGTIRFEPSGLNLNQKRSGSFNRFTPKLPK